MNKPKTRAAVTAKTEHRPPVADQAKVTPLRREQPANDGPPIEFFSAGEFEGIEPPKMEWLLSDWIPHRTAGILTGNGGAGKSWIALQFACDIVRGNQFMGLNLDRNGPAMLIACEDERNHLHRRLHSITGGNYEGLGGTQGLHLASMAGLDAFLYEGARADKLGAKTPLYHAIEAKVAEVRPAVLILDTLADFNPCSEIEKTVARQFMRDLNAIALDYDCTVMLLAHPSLSGMASGSGTSGNTAWHNSARWRLYLAPDADNESDNDVKVLSSQKNNHGPLQEIKISYQEGQFRRWAEPGLFDGIKGSHVEEIYHKLGSDGMRESAQSPEWFGHMVAEILNLDSDHKATKKRIGRMIKAWVSEGVFSVVKRKANGKETPFIVQGKLP